MDSGTDLNDAQGVAGPLAGSGDFAIGGGAGGHCIRLNGNHGLSGSGGDSKLGFGGVGRSGSGPGHGGRGFGGGAGGPLSVNGAAESGSPGQPGIVVVELYG